MFQGAVVPLLVQFHPSAQFSASSATLRWEGVRPYHRRRKNVEVALRRIQSKPAFAVACF